MNEIYQKLKKGILTCHECGINKKWSVYEEMSFKSIPFKIDMKLLIK